MLLTVTIHHHVGPVMYVVWYINTISLPGILLWIQKTGIYFNYVSCLIMN